MTPKRIQRKRTKGWRMPENTVSVTRPGEFGNPFVIGKPRPGAWENGSVIESAADAISLFRAWLAVEPVKRARIREALRGKNLACFCAIDQPCHADVLLEVANA